MTVSLKAMRYFTVALRHGNISRAATELRIAASAVSAAIDQIEAHFQLKLVTRQRSRGITPTADGQVMLRKFATLLEEFDTVLKDGAELKRSFTGALRVGYYSPVAPAFLPGILSNLMQPRHDLTLHLHEGDNDAVQLGLHRGEYDAILFVSDAAAPWIDHDPLIEAPAYCLLAADHPLAAQPAIHLADLLEEPIITLDRPVVTDYYSRLFDMAGQRPSIVAHANSTEMVRSLVGSGAGCAILNMLPLTDISYAGNRVVARPILDPLPSLTLSVGYNKQAPRRAVSEFVARCQSYFANPDALVSRA